MRIAQISTLFILVVLLGCGNAAKESIPTAKPELKVSVAVPEISGKHTVVLQQEDAHFFVVVQNVSGKPVKLWSEGNSWGYHNLSLEVMDSNSKISPIVKKEIFWSKNSASFFTLAPGESHVFEIYPRSTAWKNFPVLESGDNKIKLRAIYQIEAEEAAKQEGVFTGKVMSEFVDLTFYR